MGRKNNKKIGEKYYFQLKDSRTIQSLYANSYEEAIENLNKTYGEDNYICGQLKKAEDTKKLNKISVDVATELFGETAGRIMRDINSLL